MILAERKRVVDTFEARNTAKASRTLLENTEVYRALNGEEFGPSENAVPDEETKRRYEEYRRILR